MIVERCPPGASAGPQLFALDEAGLALVDGKRIYPLKRGKYVVTKIPEAAPRDLWECSTAQVPVSAAQMDVLLRKPGTPAKPSP